MDPEQAGVEEDDGDDGEGAQALDVRSEALIEVRASDRLMALRGSERAGPSAAPGSTAVPRWVSDIAPALVARTVLRP